MHAWCSWIRYQTLIPLMMFWSPGWGMAQELEFNRDIRPILAENCFTCHGPDQNKREGGLRLDERNQAMERADSGKVAIVPHHPEKSELISRIRSVGVETQMPPAHSEKRLTESQKMTLERWISQGAPYQGHWAFLTPQRPKLPRLKGDPGELHPIDVFIRARLEKEGVTPAQEADKVTLIRRATLDLTGLPPTLSEVEEFLSDSSPHAYEKVIDRLLNSPHYGERMALTWMDYARYADSNGFQSDGSRDIWAWRDWLIQAYNRNLPFDQFTIEQLAGDLLPNATRDQIIATGFNRNHRLNGEGGRIEAEWFVETVIDRVETTGLTWLGLTLNCCRCHDHKYDPISQKEFYSLFAIFNSIDEKGILAPVGKKGENTPPLLTLTSPEEDKKIDELQGLVDSAEKSVKEEEAKLAERILEWETLVRGQPEADRSVWQPFTWDSVTSQGGADIQKLEDGSYLVHGKNPPNDTYVAVGKMVGSELTALQLEVFPDPSLPNASLGRGSNGNFVLSEVTANITASSLPEPMKIRFNKAIADYEQKGWTAQSTIKPRDRRGDDKNIGWAVDGNDPQKRLPRKMILLVNKPLSLPPDAKIEVTLVHDSSFKDHNVGRFRISTTSFPEEKLSIDAGQNLADVKSILAVPSDERSDDQKKMLVDFYKKNVDSPFAKAKKELEIAKKKLQEFRDELPTTMVMKEGKPREAFVLVRGQYDQPSDPVQRGIPAVFGKIPDGETIDRLRFAKWIVDRKNPLTARVWVNREWERFFGTGLVKTTENFGSQAEYPSHPELLDWLASEFMEPSVHQADPSLKRTPWDMKGFQKMILMSQTYRQSSKVDPAVLKRDPENRWLSRSPRIRLQGEVLRDAALAVSDLLVKKIGGPSVRPYMPEGVWDETSKYGNLRNYKHDRGEGLYRRTMYTIWKRTAAPPSLLLFDAPNREACVVKRSRTNTPLQALSLLNEVTYVEAARHMGAKILREGGNSDRERIQYGFQLVVSRVPSQGEVDVLAKGLQDDIDRFRANPESAQQLLKAGDSPRQGDYEASIHAAYTLLANVLMNLDEFITRE